MAWAFWRSRKTTDPQERDGATDGDPDDDQSAALHVRTRRRLIGAAALLLATIIVLPLVLDSTPRPIPESVAIDIPSETTPFAPKLTPGTPASPAAIGKEDGSGGADKPKRDSPAATVAAPPALPNGPTSAAAAPHSEPATAIAPSAPPAQPAAAAAVPSVPAVAPEAKSQFALQVAALAQEDSARKLVAKLKAAGFPTYTEKIRTDKGDRIRVRVGPYATQATAEKARQKLAKMGIDARWVDS